MLATLIVLSEMLDMRNIKFSESSFVFMLQIIMAV